VYLETTYRSTHMPFESRVFNRQGISNIAP
jgi:hypothetical protein